MMSKKVKAKIVKVVMMLTMIMLMTQKVMGTLNLLIIIVKLCTCPKQSLLA